MFTITIIFLYSVNIKNRIKSLYYSWVLIESFVAKDKKLDIEINCNEPKKLRFSLVLVVVVGLFSNQSYINVLGLLTLLHRMKPKLLELIRIQTDLPARFLVIVCLQNLGQLESYEDVDTEITRTLRAEKVGKVHAEKSQDWSDKLWEWLPSLKISLILTNLLESQSICW